MVWSYGGFLEFLGGSVIGVLGSSLGAFPGVLCSSLGALKSILGASLNVFAVVVFH